MKPYDLIVVMPVYNEAEAIGPVLRKWQAMLDTLNIRYQIRAYNDGSKDNTGAILKEVSSASDGRILGVDKANSGHGPTILRGYREAAREAEWVFQIDSDDEMGPESFPKLWSMREEYDFLVGQRDGRRQPLPRKIISFVSRLCVRIFYGKGIWDVNTPYRLMRAEAFQSYYEAIPDSSFAPNVILSGLAARNNLRMTEIPVPQHDRTTGEVSIKKWKLLKAAMRSFAQTIDFSFDGHGWIAVAYPLIFLMWCAKIQFSVIANDYGYNIHVVNLMNKGLWPLVDFHSMYTQLLYWVYLPLKMVTGCYFGYTLLLFVNGLISFLVACWVYRLAKRFAVGSVLAHGAALTVLLFSLHWSNFFEPWCLLFGTLALYLYFLKEKRARLLFCGVLTGCAYLTKQNALVWLGVLGLAVLFYESSWKKRVLGGLGLTLGFVIVVLGYAVLLRMANGSWVATSVFFGDNRYTHGLGGVRETVKFILTCAMVLLPLIYLVVKQGVGRSRDVFCFMIASGMVLLILFVSPYHSNLLMGASLFALFFAIFTRDFVALRQGSAGVFCWGGAIVPVALDAVFLIGLTTGGSLLVRHGGHRAHPEISDFVTQIAMSTEKLFVFPSHGAWVADIYVESDLIPANLEVRHNNNLYWGTEQRGRDDDLIKAALDSADIVVVPENELKAFREFYPKWSSLVSGGEAGGFVVYRKSVTRHPK